MLNTIYTARKKIDRIDEKNYPRPSDFGKMFLKMKVDFPARLHSDPSDLK